MATYVYAPYSGNMTSYFGGSQQTCGQCTHYAKYCDDDDCHPCIYGSNPFDLDVPDNTWIDFYVDPSCLSVVGVHHDAITCGGAAPYEDVFELEMWTGTGGSGTKIGSFLYGHCSASFTGAVDTVPIQGTSLYGLTQVAYVAAGNIAGCYEGSHVHLESLNASAVNSGYGCSAVTIKSTWIFKYGS